MQTVEKSLKQKSYSRAAYGLIILLILSIAGLYLAFTYANNEYQRDVRNWESRMHITANIRADSVSNWIKTQRKELSDIADNISIQLYLTELAQSGSADTLSEDGELEYARNYLIATADRLGYTSNPATNSIKANLPSNGSSGIFILDSKNNSVMATPSAPTSNEQIIAFLEDNNPIQINMSQAMLDANNRPVVVFSVPIFAVQGDKNKDSLVGTVVGVRTLDDSVFPLLNYPNSTLTTEESNLVRLEGETAVYISPTLDGTPALFKRLNLEHRDYAVQFAHGYPNSFGIMRNYSSNAVLTTGRVIHGTDWLLIHKVGKIEALHESSQRRKITIALALSIIAFILVTILLTWRHGASVRVALEADKFKKLAKRFESQSSLLQLVTDNQPDAMFIIDDNKEFRFANKSAANGTSLTPAEIIGKRLVSVFGPTKAVSFEHAKEQLKNGHSSLSRVVEDTDDQGNPLYLQTKYIPISEIPNVLTDEKSSQGILMVEQNVTSVIVERKRREKTLYNTVSTLVAAVDLRDPNASMHSRRVAILAKQIAKQMDLSDELIDTVYIAATLMNIGKIYLSRELLTKKGKLTESERKQFIDSVQKGADLIKEIDFSGPVEDTMRQCQEKWDGSGPLGVKEEQIVLTARIISVANAFIAMISPRSYRKALGKDEVLDIFVEESGKKYERRVVAALITYLDNHDDALDWNAYE